MKLEKFKEKNTKKKTMIIGSIIIVLFIAIIVVYRSFAFFESREEFNIIRGQVPDQNYDVILTYVIEDKDGNRSTSDTMPTSRNYEVSVDCDKGKGEWDYNNWQIKVKDFENRTKCKIAFKEIDGQIMGEEMNGLPTSYSTVIWEVVSNSQATNTRSASYTAIADGIISYTCFHTNDSSSYCLAQLNGKQINYSTGAIGGFTDVIQVKKGDVLYLLGYGYKGSTSNASTMITAKFGAYSKIKI